MGFGYDVSALTTMAKETTVWDPITGTLQRRENDTMNIELLPEEKGLVELKKTGLCRTTKTEARKKGIRENGVMYLITCELFEYRGDDLGALSVAGFEVTSAIYGFLGGRWPATHDEYKMAEKMIREKGGTKKDNPTSKGLMMAKEAEVTAKLQVVQVEAQLAESEREKEDLQLQAVALQQQLDEARAAADAIRAEVGRLKAEASMARTRSAFASTPARSTNPAASLPTPDSLAPGAPRRQPPVEPVTPSRLGPSSSQRSFGSPADQDEDMQFFGGDDGMPDADELPQTAAFRPASPPPTPGPSNVNVHSQCEERQRELEGQLQETVTRAEAAEGILSAITRQGMAYLGLGQR